jgi:hypothetical protein
MKPLAPVEKDAFFPLQSGVSEELRANLKINFNQ